jgi:hypothetical protein
MVMVASRTIVSFLSDGSSSPGNYGWLFLSEPSGCGVEEKLQFQFQMRTPEVHLLPHYLTV